MSKYVAKRTATKRTRRPRKYARRVYKKNSFAARVKKVLHSQIENKVFSIAGTNSSISYAGSLTNPTFLNLMPQPGQGAGAHQRIGNEIRCVKSTIRGFVNLLPYSASSNPSDVPINMKMWLCRRKSNNIGDGDVPTSSDWAQFFQIGTTTAGFQSNTLDMLAYNNKEYWTVLATKQFQLANYAVLDLAASVLSTTLVPMSGKISAPFSFDITKHTGLCKYNDTTVNPCNKELFLVFQGVRVDGTVAGPSAFAEVHYIAEHQYEDA